MLNVVRHMQIQTKSLGPLTPNDCSIFHSPEVTPRYPPVKGGRFPNKVHLEVVGHLHRGTNAAPQLNGNFITIIFKTLLSNNCLTELQVPSKNALPTFVLFFASKIYTADMAWKHLTSFLRLKLSRPSSRGCLDGETCLGIVQ